MNTVSIPERSLFREYTDFFKNVQLMNASSEDGAFFVVKQTWHVSCISSYYIDIAVS